MKKLFRYWELFCHGILLAIAIPIFAAVAIWVFFYGTAIVAYVLMQNAGLPQGPALVLGGIIFLFIAAVAGTIWWSGNRSRVENLRGPQFKKGWWQTMLKALLYVWSTWVWCVNKLILLLAIAISMVTIWMCGGIIYGALCGMTSKQNAMIICVASGVILLTSLVGNSGFHNILRGPKLKKGWWRS